MCAEIYNFNAKSTKAFSPNQILCSFWVLKKDGNFPKPFHEALT